MQDSGIKCFAACSAHFMSLPATTTTGIPSLIEADMSFSNELPWTTTAAESFPAGESKGAKSTPVALLKASNDGFEALIKICKYVTPF
jgi:hypothetical protein